MNRDLIRMVAVVVLVVSWMGALPVASAGARPASGYYLALGDSVAFGYQAARDTDGVVDPARFDHGYADVVGATLDAGPGDVTTVNDACPGESTVTMVKGGCPWTASGESLHDPYSGPQLAAATTFLHAHRGQVRLVTVTLWGNDLIAFETACAGDPSCITDGAPAAIAAMSERLAGIVTALHAAAPDVKIVVTGPWNSTIDALAETDPLFAALDSAMRAATIGAGGRYASMLPIFNPQRNQAVELRAICTLTAVCAGDSHPTDLGYRAIAALVLLAAAR